MSKLLIIFVLLMTFVFSGKVVAQYNGSWTEYRLVKGSGNEVYFATKIKGNKWQKRWIPNEMTFEMLGFDFTDVETVSNSELKRMRISSAFPRIAKNLVKGSTAAVFLLEKGHRRWIPNEEALRNLGHTFDDIETLSDNEISRIPLGPKLN